MAEFRVVIEGRIVDDRRHQYDPHQAELAGRNAIADSRWLLDQEGLKLVDARVTDIQRVDKASDGEGDA